MRFPADTVEKASRQQQSRAANSHAERAGDHRRVGNVDCIYESEPATNSLEPDARISGEVNWLRLAAHGFRPPKTPRETARSVEQADRVEESESRDQGGGQVQQAADSNGAGPQDDADRSVPRAVGAVPKGKTLRQQPQIVERKTAKRQDGLQE